MTGANPWDVEANTRVALEMRRAQGWRPWWTDDGTEIADSHRYRMVGNGVVATVAEWIGRRLVAVDRWELAP